MLGISFDSPEENAAFRDKYDFPYPLLSDTDHGVGADYGVLAEHEGRAFPKRYTFLIDPDGIVRQVYKVTDVESHPDEVLSDLKDLIG